MVDHDTQLEKHSLKFSENDTYWSTLDRFLGAAPGDFNQDIDDLLRGWLELTGANWAWFWLSHIDTPSGRERWEIFCSCSRNADTLGYSPKKMVSQENHGMAVQYAVHLNRPVFVNDLPNWRKDNSKMTYSVTRWRELQEHKVQSFLAIPLKFVSGGKKDVWAVLGLMSGGICLHFESATPPVPLLPENAYMVLAKASARAISSFFVAAQQSILNRLDILAAEYLTKAGMKPEDRRKEYLREVTGLIRSSLRVKRVSFFYETQDGDAVECVYTTGLASKDGRLLEEVDWHHARYRRGQNITGKVFETGVPHVWQAEGAPSRPYGECVWKEIPAPEDVDERAWLAWPIMTPHDPQDKKSTARVLGVIRCVDNYDGFELGHIRPFDPVQLQTLEFITAQMAPILETMTASIRRERMVNIVKHDIYAPLRVIHDQATLLKTFFETYASRLASVQSVDKKLIEYLPSNIKASVALANNLAGFLGDQQAFNPEPTHLEADIIARLRDGLGYYAGAENQMKINYANLRDLPVLVIDRNLIERALCNLLLNAIKYGYAHTDIDVVGEVRYNEYVIRVENSGIEIPPEDLERIFQGDYRGKHARQRRVGLGLGLKIARKAMLQHGGDLILESKETTTQRTVFSMLFPKRLAVQERYR